MTLIPFKRLVIGMLTAERPLGAYHAAAVAVGAQFAEMQNTPLGVFRLAAYQAVGPWLLDVREPTAAVGLTT